MPLELLVSEATLIAGLDAQLDTAFLTGVEFPAANPIIPKLDGYDKPMLIQGIDQAPVYKPKIRNPFSSLMAAVMKAVQIWVTPVLAGTWVVLDPANLTSPGYYRDFMGRVYLRGVVRTGTIPSTVFTLPTGYCPTKTHTFPVVSNNLLGVVTVQSDGQIVVTVGDATSVSLDSISFRAEQ